MARVEAVEPVIKSIPNNIEAERAVLGALLIDPNVADEVFGMLTSKDFFRERHAWVFDAMLSLHEQGSPIEFVLLGEELKRMGRIEEIGGPAYITDLITVTPTAMFAAHYATIVKRTAELRRLIVYAGHLAELAYDENGDPYDIARRAAGALDSVSRPQDTQEAVTMTDILREEMSIMGRYLDANEKGEKLGLRFGWHLDDTLGGLQPGNLAIVAARPGVGKTTLTLNMAMRLAEDGAAGIFFSMEMARSEVIKKMISNYSGVDSALLRNYTIDEEQLSLVMQGVEKVNQLPLMIVDTRCDTVSAIRSHIKRCMAMDDIEFIVVDYMQLMTTTRDEIGNGDNRQMAMEFISQSLKSIAKEFGIVVIAASQLNRGVEYRQDKRPMLADLRSSGAIEQSGDCVMFIYREDMYGETDNDGVAEINVSKNRHGRTGTTKMYFDKALSRFGDIVFEKLVEDGYPTEKYMPRPFSEVIAEKSKQAAFEGHGFDYDHDDNGYN